MLSDFYKADFYNGIYSTICTRIFRNGERTEKENKIALIFYGRFPVMKFFVSPTMTGKHVLPQIYIETLILQRWC